MKFDRYLRKDEAQAKKMMEASLDYTPNLIADAIIESMTDFFEESFILEPYKGIFFALKSDNGEVKGLMAVSKRPNKNGGDDWHIDALFAHREEQADEHAGFMVEQFCALVHEAREISADIHPEAERARAFWESIGFRADLNKPLSSNADDEVLVSYWKTINEQV